VRLTVICLNWATMCWFRKPKNGLGNPPHLTHLQNRRVTFVTDKNFQKAELRKLI
jgi:hypothetical protein